MNLIDTKESEEIKYILESPLGLASKIIQFLFEDDFDSLVEDLDVIKEFAGGVKRASNLSSTYAMAGYYPHMFSFQQFVNSSYRARQGIVLERMMEKILGRYGGCDKVPSSKTGMRNELNRIFQTKLPQLDLDGLGINTLGKKAIIIQLRSRDDTGGSTAKGSLVDLAKALIRSGNTPTFDVHYLICVWDPRNSAQKLTTVRKMYSSLQELISIPEQDFMRDVFTGVRISDGLTLRLAYGTSEISRSLYQWIDEGDQGVLSSIVRIQSTVENWDDLWVAYAVASLELRIRSIHGHSNIELLEKKYKEISSDFDFSTYADLSGSINAMAKEMVEIWKEDTIPFRSPSDQFYYIRDLLFLYACYFQIQ